MNPFRDLPAMVGPLSLPPLDQDAGPVQMLASAITPTGVLSKAGEGTRKVLTTVVGKAFDPMAETSWGGLGAAAPRFGPWIVLLAMAWIVRTVIASILADRTAGPRRRRWTLL
jgi:hypothetical protein